jgi:hypothetical protein
MRNLDRRLSRLEQSFPRGRRSRARLSNPERWLRLLQLVTRFMRERATPLYDQHCQAIAILEAYVQSGRVNARVELFCETCLYGAVLWHRGLSGSRLIFLEPDHLARLQQATQTAKGHTMP